MVDNLAEKLPLLDTFLLWHNYSYNGALDCE